MRRAREAAVISAATLAVGPWLFSCAPTRAQEHLEPEQGIFSHSDDSLRYRVAVRRLVETEYVAALSVVCLPSFRPEWVISLREDKGQFFVFLAEARKPLYMKERPGDIPVDRKSALIDAKLSKNLQMLWRDALMRVHYPAPREDGIIAFTADGERYHFTAIAGHYGLVAGQIQSPERGTLPSSLVAIAEKLREYAKADAKRRSAVARAIEAEVGIARRRMQPAP